MKRAHKTSVYILQDETGKLHVYTHRPTDPYEGRKDRDQYDLALGLKIKNPTHELWIGEIECILVTGYSCGLLETSKKCVIVAKESYIWDYTKPVGQRKSEQKISKRYTEAFQVYLNQNKK